MSELRKTQAGTERMVELSAAELEVIAGGAKGGQEKKKDDDSKYTGLWSWYPTKRRADAANNARLSNVAV
jgi:hypothetical protein